MAKENGIIRVHKTENFSTLSNIGLRDTRLSYAARGVLAYLLTKPDDWKVTTQDLIAQSPHGRDAVRNMLRELQFCGYLKRLRTRDVVGLYGWSTEVFETPQEGEEWQKSFQENSENSPAPDFPAQVSQGAKERLNKERLNKEASLRAAPAKRPVGPTMPGPDEYDF